MTVVQGAGVGGGSLVYPNISIPAKEKTFESGWPAEIAFAELKPYYASVGTMLNVKPVPQAQWPVRTKLIKKAASQAGFADKFEPLELAGTFDENWNYDLQNPHSVARSKPITNRPGAEAGHVRASRQLRHRMRCRGSPRWTSTTWPSRNRRAR